MLEMKNFRIALAGAGGTGKSTLAQAWCEKHGAIAVKAETSKFMPEGIKSHLDVLKMATISPKEGVGFQNTLIRERSKLFKDCKTGFISDRSVADSYAYYAVHNSMFDTPENNKELFDLAINSTVNNVDLTVMFYPDLREVPDNGVRVVSLPYYHAISGVMLNILATAQIKAGNPIGVHNFRVDNSLQVNLTVFQDTAMMSMIEICEPNQEGLCMSSVESRMKAIEMAIEIIYQYN